MRHELYKIQLSDDQMHMLLMLSADGPQPISRLKGDHQMLRECGMIGRNDDHGKVMHITDLGRHFISIT
jgi:hypothetical protein